VGKSVATAYFQGKIFLAHCGANDGSIFIASSTDGSFSGAATRVSNWAGRSISLTVLNGFLIMVHCGFSDGAVYIASSDEKGNFTENANRVSDWVGDCVSLAVDSSNRLTLAYCNSGGAIYTAVSTSINFSGAATRISNWSGKSLSIAFFDGKLYLAHCATSDGTVYIASSTDGTFSEGATKVNNWSGRNVFLKQYRSTLTLTHCANSDGSIYIASMHEDKFIDAFAQRVSNWAGTSVALEVLDSNKLFMFHTGIQRGDIYSGSCAPFLEFNFSDPEIAKGALIVNSSFAAKGISGVFYSNCSQWEPGEFMNGAIDGDFYIHKAGSESYNGRYVSMQIIANDIWFMTGLSANISHNSRVSTPVRIALETSTSSDFTTYDTLCTTTPLDKTLLTSFSVSRQFSAGTRYIRLRIVTPVPDNSNYISYRNVAISSAVTPSLAIPFTHEQIMDIANKYAPVIKFHPDETFFPCTIDWYLQHSTLHGPNGYTKVNPTSSDLPTVPENDLDWWLEMQDTVKNGDLDNARVSLHIRWDGTSNYTDLQYWVSFGYNGPGTLRLQCGFQISDIPLDPLGEHWADWEMISIRIDNATHQPIGVFLSQHGKGPFITDLSQFQRQGDQFVVYSAKDSHSHWPNVGDNDSIESGDYGILKYSLLNVTANGGKVFDTRGKLEAVACDFLPSMQYPNWLNYKFRWGRGKDTYVPISVIIRALKGVPILWFIPGGLTVLATLILQFFPVDNTNGVHGPKCDDENWNGTRLPK
jgi:hypothetical protein